jgi:hypothetical protein
MSWHASAEDLARYFEGDLKPRKITKIASHLGECSQCAELSEQLQAVPTLLANVQYPPMPGYLSSRIEMAIASESVTRLASQPASEAGRRDLPPRAKHARQSWRMPGLSSPRALRVMAATGAALIVAGGGYAIATNVGSGTSPSASTSAPSSAHVGTGTAAVPLTFGQTIHYQHGGQTDSIKMVQTPTDFQPANFRQQTIATLDAARAGQHRKSASAAVPGNSTNSQGLGAASPPPRTFSRDKLSTLRGCLDAIAAGRNVLLMDAAKFRGTPAYIIVVGSTAGGPAEAFAVGAGCSAANKAILFSQQLPGV